MKILELSLMCSFNSIQYCFTTQAQTATINAMGFRISPPKVVQRPARPQTVRSQNVAMAAARGATFWPGLGAPAPQNRRRTSAPSKTSKKIMKISIQSMR